MTLHEIPGNKFAAVALIRARANAIASGAEPRVYAGASENHVTTALREYAAGEISIDPELQFGAAAADVRECEPG